MITRIACILLIGLLSVSLIFTWVFSVQSSRAFNRRQAHYISEVILILEKRLNHYFSQRPQISWQERQDLMEILKDHSGSQGKTAFLINRFGRILAHPKQDYTGYLLPPSSPLRSLIKKGRVTARTVAWRNKSLVAIRPVFLQSIKIFVVVTRPMQKVWPLFLSYLSSSAAIAGGAFLVLMVIMFWYLKSFIQAGQFLFRLFTKLDNNARKDAICYLARNHNAYLSPIRPNLLSMLQLYKNKVSVSHKAFPHFSDIIQRIVRQSHSRYPHMSVRVQQDADIPLPIFAESLFQSVWELIKNAAEASNHQGLVAIDIYEKDLWFCCTVSDQGSGMSRGVMSRACELNFSTKKSSIGMGLTFVKKMVSRMGGKIHFHSPSGAGLTVVLMIPTDYVEYIKNLGLQHQQHIMSRSVDTAIEWNEV